MKSILGKADSIFKSTKADRPAAARTASRRRSSGSIGGIDARQRRRVAGEEGRGAGGIVVEAAARN